MGILDSLFKLMSKKEEITFEVEALRILIDDCKYGVKIIMRDGTRVSAEDFFKKSKNFLFSRFFISEEELIKPQFAPSLEKAIDWFLGKNLPKEGYSNISWGKKIRSQCTFCYRIFYLPFHIKKIESLVIFRKIPDYKEIVGWRVSEVVSELLGKGTPTKYFTINEEHAVIKWDSPQKKIICKRCSDILEKNGREDELENYIILNAS
jgi:hypothetical protein